MANVGQHCPGLCSTTRNKDPLEFSLKRKRAGLRAICAVMDGGDRISWKGKSWSCSGVRSPCEWKCRAPVSKMVPLPLTVRNSWIFTLNGTTNVTGLSLCPLRSVPLCLMGGHFPTEAGIGPAHHVMPGTDIGFWSADRLSWGGIRSWSSEG